MSDHNTSQYESQINDGLPNVGNTCFINSALQALYSIVELRNKILESESKHSQLEIILKIIFRTLEVKTQLNKKEAVLRRFQKLLISITEDYNLYDQQDSLRILLIVIQKLVQQNPQIQRIFKFSYKLQCLSEKCNQQNIFQNQLVLTTLENKCLNSQCESLAKFIFVKEPQALIIKSKNYIEQEIYFFVQQTNKYPQYKKISFRLKSEILYDGNKKSGHYKCLRISKKIPFKYRLYDDSRVSEQKRLKEFQQVNQSTPLVTLYEQFGEKQIFSEKIMYSQVLFPKTHSIHTKCENNNYLTTQQKQSPMISSTLNSKIKSQFVNSPQQKIQKKTNSIAIKAQGQLKIANKSLLSRCCQFLVKFCSSSDLQNDSSSQQQRLSKNNEILIKKQSQFIQKSKRIKPVLSSKSTDKNKKL